MAILAKWDEDGQRLYETGCDRGMLYDIDSNGEYKPGVPWNGLSQVTESPSGAEITDIYANNTKYLSLISAETFGFSIQAYMSPEEFDKCDGTALLDDDLPGVTVKQQNRKSFGFCYRSIIGNDTEGNDHGYKLHLFYGCKAQPSEKTSQTVNDSPEASDLSWECKTTPVDAGDSLKKTSVVEIDSTKFWDSSTNSYKAEFVAFEEILYGKKGATSSDDVAPRMPLPSEVKTLLKAAAQQANG